MILKRMKIPTGVGEETNCYIIFDEDSKDLMVIDPAGDVERIVEMIDVLQGNLKYIYLTHCHGDHIGGVTELKNQKGGKILISKDDAEGLNNRNINLSTLLDMPEIELEADSRVEDEDLLHIGDLEFKVLLTPGHTAGSSCLYCKEENLLFSGDTIFKGAWGRTDLPTSSFMDILSSITNKLMTLPDDTIVYPGHGRSTLIREEKPIYLELKPGIE